MTKEAITQYPVHELISKRWSSRAFSNKAISENEIQTLMEAASWAPSSMNEQPWNYLYSIKDTVGFKKMWSCLSPGNQIWVKDAPILIMCIANKTFAKNGEYNRHYLHDTGMANANLLTQATSMDIYGHILGGYDRVKTDDEFSISDDKEVVCFIALGYLGDSEKLDEPFKSREVAPRSRKSLSEFLKKF